MSDFSLFEKALDEYNKENDVISSCNDGDIINENNGCEHLNFIEDHGIVCCVDCGIEMEKNIFHDKEWRYYGQSDNKRLSDPNRVHLRKIEDKNIYGDVENMGFSDKIVALANQIYIQVTKGKIFRGKSRKSIIFASVYHSYKINGKPQPHENLIKIFKLDRKSALNGLKHVNLNVPKDSVIHTTYVTPVNLVDDIMDKFNATPEQKQEVKDLYERIKNKSSKINRARPQSISSSVVFFWTCYRGMDISLKDFASKTELSELTISKIAREISDILKIPIYF
jgi:transcription initiation factor TFIIIB Brf1 subunit/transcription initiation factor TFIIB